jgi:hypothetical protein
MPPTANPSAPGNEAYPVPSAQQMPVPPTANRGGASGYSNSYGRAVQQQAAQMGPGGRFSGGGGTAPPPQSEKAFAGIPAVSNGVSPYLNLFRGGGEGVDNYNTLVRPQLDQRQLNQRYGQDIYGLERQARIQQAMSQRAPARPLQSVGTPQYFMNYGNYYQGYQSWNWYGAGFGGQPYPPAGLGR